MSAPIKLLPLKRKTVIGVVHLNPLPGSPQCKSSLDEIESACLKDAANLCEGGVDAIILENYGDSPFHKARVEPHTTAIMAVLLSKIASRSKIPLGVNVLRNDGLAALGVALASGASFIRINVLSGAAVTDQGIIEGEADRILRYRCAIGADAALLADIHVKHSRPLGNTLIEDAAKDAVLRAHADCLIVTGSATGSAIDLNELKAVKKAVPKAPLIAGSGLTYDNAEQIMAIADGAIVGTWLKEGGEISAPVDIKRTAKLVRAVHDIS